MMHTMLAIRTHFSVGESVLTPEKAVEEAVAIGQSVVAITDTMSVTGMIDFSTRARKADIRPLIGTRLRLTDAPEWRPEKGEKKKHMPRVYYLTVYPRTEAGMKAIYRLLTLANSEDRFYYVSKLGFADLYKELDTLDPGDLVVVYGDEQSVLEHPQIHEIAGRIDRLVDHRFAALMPVNTPYHGRCNLVARELCDAGLAKPLVLRPVLYGIEDYPAVLDIIGGVMDNASITDGWFKMRFAQNLKPLKPSDMTEEVKAAALHLSKRGVGLSDAVVLFREGLRNTEELVSLIGFEWTKQPVSLPVMAPDEFSAVISECKKGWAERFSAQVFGHAPSREELEKVYKPRLKYELEILRKLDFSGYFLLVQDIVRYAKSNDILVGPGRGSVGGSLVAYLMGITECDPIRFELLFERFINPERIDLPDADLDFMSERRHEVVEYLVMKYGEKRVAGVSNFGTLQAASAIRDIAKVVNIPSQDASVSKFTPKLHGANVPLPECAAKVPEIGKFAEKYDVAWDIMVRLEGTIRNFSQHAAGIVVGGVDLEERAVIERRKEGSVVCWDKRMVEEQGLVKVDILGLRTLDLIALTLGYIRERHGKRVDLSRIPLDDPKVLDNFAKARTTGIFQFESSGMRSLLRKIAASGIITFEDITAATALYRPGPMESGMMDSFHLRKSGMESVNYDHPLMEPILKTTFGVIVYQEQVMQISRVIAGYSGAEADKLRKIMGKKLPEEMRKERSKFVEGCVATIQCNDEWAGALFDKIEGFAGYGFNRSHSIEYTLISYQAMWLKTNFPVEFYAAGLTLMDTDKLPGLIADAEAFGVEIDMPDINLSTDRFEILTDTRVIIPFQRIKGVSEKTAEAILTARKAGAFKNKADFVSRVERRRCNISHQDKLDRVGAFARIEPGQRPAKDPSRTPDQIELIPGLISAHVQVQRDMNTCKLTREAIADNVSAYTTRYGLSGEHPDGLVLPPSFPKTPRFMVVLDSPDRNDEGNGVIYGSGTITEALEAANTDRSDAFITAMIRRPKVGGRITQPELDRYRSYLDRELEILKPPLVVLLGTNAVRGFFPDFKGKVSDAAGKVIYDRDRDMNFVIGFNPGEIWHDPSKQDLLNKVFQVAAEIIN